MYMYYLTNRKTFCHFLYSCVIDNLNVWNLQMILQKSLLNLLILDMNFLSCENKLMITFDMQPRNENIFQSFESFGERRPPSDFEQPSLWSFSSARRLG